MNELRLVDAEGYTSLDLLTYPVTLIDYVPAVAPAGAVATAEKLTLALGGATLAEALALREAIERCLCQADRVQAGSGERRIYVELRREYGLPLWRSELVGGRFVELDYEGYWPERAQVRAAIVWARRPYWEGELANVGTLNGAGEIVYDDVPIYCGAGEPGLGNHLDLGPVAGDLPAPFQLRWTNQASLYPVTRLYMGLRSSPDPCAFTHLLEGESATVAEGVFALGMNNGVDHCSGGGWIGAQWATRAEQKLLYWDWQGYEESSAAGSWYRVMAHWYPAPAYTDLYVQARLVLADETVLWSGPWVKPEAGRELCELGSLRVPPFDGAYWGLQPLRIQLWARRDAGGTHQLAVDYLALLCMDGFRRYDALGPWLTEGTRLVDDGMAREIYAHQEEGNVNYWLAAGDVPLLRPGNCHRLVWLWESTGGFAWADKEARVMVMYRARTALP